MNKKVLNIIIGIVFALNHGFVLFNSQNDIWENMGIREGMEVLARSRLFYTGRNKKLWDEKSCCIPLDYL